MHTYRPQPTDRLAFRWILPLLFVALLGGCDSEEPSAEGPGEEELIDRVVLTLSPADNMADVVSIAENEDGLNGLPSITVDPLVLRAGMTYEGTVAFFNTEADEDVTEEVREEAEEHQVFFTVSGLSGVNVAVTDRESDYGAVAGGDLPVGLRFTVTVASGASGEGTLRVQLAHYDDEPKDGTSLSDETDVDYTVPVRIQ